MSLDVAGCFQRGRRHLYILRAAAGYRTRRQRWATTHPTGIAIGERRAPPPGGRSGYLRIDSVHQGEEDGVKGVYDVNDNASHQLTKCRSRHSNDNAELGRGKDFPSNDRNKNGIGSAGLFAHLGGDIGASHSYRMGISWLGAWPKGRESPAVDLDDVEVVNLFDGDSYVYAADFVWKWAPNGDPSYRNFKLQGELLWRDEHGALTYDAEDASAHAAFERATCELTSGRLSGERLHHDLEAVLQEVINHDRHRADGDEPIACAVEPRGLRRALRNGPPGRLMVRR